MWLCKLRYAILLNAHTQLASSLLNKALKNVVSPVEVKPKFSDDWINYSLSPVSSSQNVYRLACASSFIERLSSTCNQRLANEYFIAPLLRANSMIQQGRHDGGRRGGTESCCMYKSFRVHDESFTGYKDEIYIKASQKNTFTVQPPPPPSF